jgi:hypothetical protein
MPNMTWSLLNRMQLGRYAEYYAKMEFSSYGFDVYTSEVDDHGVDFVAKPPNSTTYYEVQVKSVRGFGYVFMPDYRDHRRAHRRGVRPAGNRHTRRGRGHYPAVY